MKDLGNAWPTGNAGSLDIDLRTLGPIYDRDSLRHNRNVVYILIGAGVVFAIFGLLPPYAYLVGNILIVGCGSGLVLFGVSNLGRLPRAAVRLRVNASGVDTWTADGRAFHIDWFDPKLRLLVSNLPNTRGWHRPPGLEDVEFRLMMKNRVIALLPGSSLHELMIQAAAHGIPVSEWAADPLGINRSRTIGRPGLW